MKEKQDDQHDRDREASRDGKVDACEIKRPETKTQPGETRRSDPRAYHTACNRHLDVQEEHNLRDDITNHEGSYARDDEPCRKEVVLVGLHGEGNGESTRADQDAGEGFDEENEGCSIFKFVKWPIPAIHVANFI